MQTDMNQQPQSLLIKFLSERVDKAKKESTEAVIKLANYSKLIVAIGTLIGVIMSLAYSFVIYKKEENV